MRRMLVVALGGLALLLAGAGFAWACTPQSTLDLTVRSGKSGMLIGVTGEDYYPGEVEVLWLHKNGEREHLQFVETATGDFRTEITVPDDAEPGTHYVRGVWAKDGSTYRATASFTVQSDASGTDPERDNEPGTATQQADGGPTEGPNASDNDSPSETSQPAQGSNGGDGDTAGDHTGTDSGSRGQAQPGSSSSGGSSGQALQGGGSAMPTTSPQPNQAAESPEGQPERDPAATSQSDPAQQIGADQPSNQQADPAPQPNSEAARPSQNQQAPQPSAGQDQATRQQGAAPQPPVGDRDTAEADSQPTSQPVAADPDGQTTPGRPGTDATAPTDTPSARTGSADLWSGLSTANGDAALTSGPEQAAGATQPANTGGQLILALALLAGGVLTLLSGGFAAAARRRRALATTNTRAN